MDTIVEAVKKIVFRFIVSGLVILLMGHLMPGFALLEWGEILVLALVVAGVGFILEGFLEKPLGTVKRGLVGFVATAGVIFGSQFVVYDMEPTLLALAVAGVIVGLADILILEKLL